jgi:hypothetical protein
LTEDELSEAIGILARWKHRKELKLIASEIYWLKVRLEDLGIVLNREPAPRVA